MTGVVITYLVILVAGVIALAAVIRRTILPQKSHAKHRDGGES